MTLNYQSFTRHYLTDSWTVQNSPPVTANNYLYCQLTNVGSTNSWLYTQAFILNSNTCTEGILCSNEDLYIFNRSDCSGPYEHFTISTTESTVNSSFLTTLKVKNTIIESGQLNFRWTAYTPGWELVPTHKCPMEIIALIAYILSVSGSFIVSLYYFREYHLERGTKNLYLSITQMSWALYSGFYWVYIYYIFPSANSLFIFEFISCVPEVATLSTAIISSFTLMEIIKPKSRQIIHTALITFLCVLYVALCFPWYIRILIEFFDYELGFLIYSITYQIHSIWIVFVFIFDAIPNLALLLFIKSYYHQTDQNLLTIYQLNSRLFYLIAVQLSNTLLYAILSLIQNRTDWVGSDRNFLAINGINQLIYMIHSVTIVWIYNEMKVIAQRVISMKTIQKYEFKDKEQERAVVNHYIYGITSKEKNSK